MRRILAVLCAFAVLLTPTAAHASTKKALIRSMAFNICGSMCNKGSMTPAAYTLKQIRSRSLDVVSLQEICYSQYRYIKDRLPRGYSTAFTTTKSLGSCDDHDRRYGRIYGMALIVKGSRVGSKQVKTLPSGRLALGMYAAVKGKKLFAASIHNAPSPAQNEGDLSSLYKWLRAKRGPILSAGDYNSFLDQPGLIRFKTYFTDADHADNEITFNPFGGRKIDYIFTSPQFTGETGDTLSTAASDHRIYLGSAWL